MGRKQYARQVIDARMKSGLSQPQFAALLGVPVRTLQSWEQGRKQPSGAARALLAIALRAPETLGLSREGNAASSTTRS